MNKLAVIGAGAAGCFCAANLRRMMPDISITIFESQNIPLAKLAVTGGGRCNITNSFQGMNSVAEAYPRGWKLMKRALKEFSQDDTVRWFEACGVPLVLQEDHCWFPRSQDAMDVVRCLLKGVKGVEMRMGTPVVSVKRSTVKPGMTDGRWLVNGEAFDYVLVTSGGSPKGLPFIEGIDLEIEKPVPSLFTFNIKDEWLRSLMGITLEAVLSIPGTGIKSRGTLLITDWGLSGPAALKLSSYAARYLAECDYRAPLIINWTGLDQKTLAAALTLQAAKIPQKYVSNTSVLKLPGRLVEGLVARAGLRPDIRWAELGSKGMNKLIATLTGDGYTIDGKTRFRDEFVTCGGVSLKEVDPGTLECRRNPGLFFAGEVLDIDAITGGFNLQAAWSTGYIVARAIAHPSA